MAALLEAKATLVDAMRADKYESLAADCGWDFLGGDAVFAGSPEQPVLSVTAADGGAQGHSLSRIPALRPGCPLYPGFSERTI